MDVNIDSSIYEDFDRNKIRRKFKKVFNCKTKIKCPVIPKKNRFSRKKRKIY